VNISVKGTTTGTISDAEGRYSLNVPGNGATLVFSFVGYTPEEVAVGNQDAIDVSLAPDTKALGEVVVVGYGTQRKAETTGSIASVKAAELTQTPVANVAQGLQARAAGVQITQNNAAPGGNISVRIRGTNSINGTSEPLYVIDGIQITNSGGVNDVSPLSSINPNDIESVEVLKDASATAIYGARAANGVVLITTKRGKAGATRVTYDGYYGVQQTTKTIGMLNATQFAELENEVYKSQVYPDPAAPGEGVNWQDLVLRDAPIQNTSLPWPAARKKRSSPFGQLLQPGRHHHQFGIQAVFAAPQPRPPDQQPREMGTSIFGSYSVNDRIPTGESSLDAPAVTNSIVGAALAAPPTLQPTMRTARFSLRRPVQQPVTAKW
jgi:TonB-dependent SusC/RagA subfamily outer membrane receptor